MRFEGCRKRRQIYLKYGSELEQKAVSHDARALPFPHKSAEAVEEQTFNIIGRNNGKPTELAVAMS